MAVLAFRSVIVRELEKGFIRIADTSKHCRRYGQQNHGGETNERIMKFDRSYTGFETTKTSHLWRASLVLRLSASDFIVKHAVVLMHAAKKILGKRLFSVVMQMSFYGHFCIGDTQQEIEATIKRLSQNNIRPLLLVTAEEESKEDCDEQGDEEAWYVRSKDLAMQCIDISSQSPANKPPKFVHFKLSALVKLHVMEKLSMRINQIKKENKGNGNNSIVVTLNYLRCLLNDQSEGTNRSVFTESEITHLQLSISRLEDICRRAHESGVYILVDAEYTSINPAIRVITFHTMDLFNKDSPIVQQTYQAYLKETKAEVAEGLDFCLDNDIYFGAKIVRGAYIGMERSQADKQRREDPVCDNLTATNESYNGIVMDVLPKIASNLKINLVVATHNEESINMAIEKLREYGIDPNSGRVTFAQTYGLADYITNWLGKHEFIVIKSTPVGAIEDSLPYLSRRAQENNIAKNIRKDQMLIKCELRKRFWFGKMKL